MFIPVNEEGNVLEKPIEKNFRYNGTSVDNMYYQLLEQYEKAQSKVLFKGWKLDTSWNQSHNIFLKHTSKWWTNYAANENSVYWKSTDDKTDKTIEEFMLKNKDLPLELTEVALKQIGI